MAEIEICAPAIGCRSFSPGFVRPLQKHSIYLSLVCSFRDRFGDLVGLKAIAEVWYSRFRKCRPPRGQLPVKPALCFGVAHDEAVCWQSFLFDDRGNVAGRVWGSWAGRRG